MKQNISQKILVGLSGGVDSAVCALLLKQQGYQVVGVHFMMGENDSSKSAKKIADYLDIPFIVEDVSKEFKQLVVDDFVERYSCGKTPNPCVICNRQLKYQKLIELADREGALKVATGHYARIISEDGRHFLLKGKDQAKDQSYFLYRLDQQQLARITLPLGKMNKEEVKLIAEREDLPVESKESQDVCFFAGQDSLAVFLERHFSGHPGEIVDEDGARLGSHKGVEFFTIGQRKGLDIGGKGPYYVFDKDNEKALVKVTSDHEHPSLLCSEIEIEDANWIFGEPEEEKKYQMKTRYQTRASKGKLVHENGKWKALLEHPQWAVAKGQSLVVFDGEKVLGGGIIRQAS